MRCEKQSLRRAAWCVCGALIVGCWSSTAAAQDEQTTAPASQPVTTGDGVAGMWVRSGESQVRFEQGRLYYHNGQFSDAEIALRRCIAADSRDAQAFYYLGLSLTGQERPTDAIGAFNTALGLDPNLIEARAGRAAAMIRAKQYDAASNDIDALAADAQWADTTAYLRGQLAYAKGDYKSAASAFAEVHARGGDEAGAAGLYEGLSYVQLKQLNRAQAALRDVGRIERDPSVAAASRALDSSIDVNTGRTRPFRLQMAVGYEWDSNVTLIDSGTIVPARHKQDGRFVLQPQASYSPIRTERVEAGIDTTNYFAFQTLDNNFDIASYQVGAFGNFRICDNFFAGIRYDFNYLQVGHDSFLNRNMVTPSVTLLEPRFGYTTAYYQFEARQFLLAPPSAALDRDGQKHVLGVIQGFDLHSMARAGLDAPRLEAGLRYENDDTSGSDFDGNFITGSVAFISPICRNWTGDVGLELSYFNYNNPNSLDSGGRDREDFEVRPHLGLTWRVNQFVAVRGDYTYTYHQSNVLAGAVRPYQYNQHIVGARVILTY